MPFTLSGFQKLQNTARNIGVLTWSALFFAGITDTKKALLVFRLLSDNKQCLFKVVQMIIVCVVRVTGVEPAWYCYHKNLNLTRLPISPYPQILSDKFYTARTLRGQTHIFSHKCFTAEVKLSFADIRIEALKRFLIRLINIADFIAFCQPFSWLYNAILKNYLYRHR